jgi:HEAT repeat protein
MNPRLRQDARPPRRGGRILPAALLAAGLLVPAHVAAQDPPGPGIFALQSMLQDRTPEIRRKAAQGLSRVGGRQAVIILRRGLADRDTQVRIAVVEALGFVGGRLALTVLSEALKDRDPSVRLRAVEALKDAGTVAAIPILSKAFEDRESSVRLHAALMLRKIGHRDGVPVLGRAVMADRDASVRAACARYLGTVGVKDPRAVGILRRVVTGDSSPAVRVRAVESLAYVQLPQAIPVLQTALADRDPGVRIRATEVMGRVLSKDFE